MTITAPDNKVRDLPRYGKRNVAGEGMSSFLPISGKIHDTRKLTRYKYDNSIGIDMNKFLTIKPSDLKIKEVRKRDLDRGNVFSYHEPKFYMSETKYRSTELERKRASDFMLGALTEVEEHPVRTGVIFGVSVIAPEVIGVASTYIGAGTTANVIGNLAGVGLMGATAYSVGSRISKAKNRWFTGGSIFGGEFAPAMAGYYVGTRYVPKVIDLWRTRGMREIPQALPETKPFFKPTEDRYVFMERYEGMKLTKPSTWLQEYKGMKKGQFTKRTYRTISPEVSAYYEGKSTISFWDVGKGGKIKLTTKEATPFPYDSKPTHTKYFTDTMQKVYYTPGQSSMTKPIGVSATPMSWGDKQIPIGEGGKYYSGKGISAGFTGLKRDQYISTNILGGTPYPEVHKTYFESVRVKPALREATLHGTYGKFKQYQFKGGVTAETLTPKGAHAVDPFFKPEVETIIPGGTLSTRTPKNQYIKFLGRRVTLIEETLTAPSSPTISTSKAVTTISDYNTYSQSTRSSSAIIRPTTFIGSLTETSKPLSSDIKPTSLTPTSSKTFKIKSTIKSYPKSFSRFSYASKISSSKIISSPIKSYPKSNSYKSISKPSSRMSSSKRYKSSSSLSSLSYSSRPSSYKSSISGLSSVSKPLRKTNIIVPKISFDRPKLKSKTKKKRITKTKTGYTPSLKAEIFKIKGKKPKKEVLMTGLFTRPIIKKTKTKRRRKR